MSPTPPAARPGPWDWTEARQRIAAWPPARAILDQLLGDVRAHLHAAGITHPDRQHAEAMWVGARLVVEQLAPILRDGAAGGAVTASHVQAHINVVQDLCCAARDLWPTSAAPRTEPAGLLGTVEQLRRDHNGGT